MKDSKKISDYFNIVFIEQISSIFIHLPDIIYQYRHILTFTRHSLSISIHFIPPHIYKEVYIQSHTPDYYKSTP
ncbi:hypothetical protein CcNV_046 [Crangon crangon nudivirus]|uniref:Uncharacterized protein n=1 Tax=Crangon crangon nudivirus TaxID=2880838 RepID=A0AAE9BZV3_9VIRU|nr:hypothetical protein QKT25_gp046 [Crangon crangon nudivirus]UBZ25530.1 hypothetical protein CcNV_046 [Crangon crangon nudivirus]